MKGKIAFSLLGTFLIVLICYSTTWARQIVTQEERIWAKKILVQEKSIQKICSPNSLAILYFQNKTGSSELDLLQKGLTLMLISDLSKIPNFKLVERARLQALIDELHYEKNELFSKEGQARIGKLLGVEHVIGGDITKYGKNKFRLHGNIVNVAAQDIIAQPKVQGKLLDDLFQMEKELLFQIIDEVNIELSSQLLAELKAPLANDLDAVSLLFKGLEFSDQGDLIRARESFEEAVQKGISPDFAVEFLGDTTFQIENRPDGEEPGHEGKPGDRGDPDQEGRPNFEGEPRHPGEPGEENRLDPDRPREPGEENWLDPDRPREPGVANWLDPDRPREPYTDKPFPEGKPFPDNFSPLDFIPPDDIANMPPPEEFFPIEQNPQNFDADGDHFTINEGDCNDTDPGIHPGAFELCNNIDDDCNGTVDDGACTEFITGNHPFIVDPASINLAYQRIFFQVQPMVDIENNFFKPGYLSASNDSPWGYSWQNEDGSPSSYQAGLQTMGTENGSPTMLMDQASIDEINRNPFLAYVVQVEEDRLNNTILEMYTNQARGDLLEQINIALGAENIRSRDNLLMVQADAQAGRVLLDQAGNWVRVQQYILRPDTTTIQILNVSLRGSGTHKGMTSMNFTTTLNNPFETGQDLRDLPWSDWLNTQDPAKPTTTESRFITSSDQTHSPASMSVQFTGPSGDYLQESRSFGDLTPYGDVFFQTITSESLDIAANNTVQTFSYTNDRQNAPSNEYWVETNTAAAASNPGGFTYMHGSDDFSGVAELGTVGIMVVGDGYRDSNRGVNQNFSTQNFKDIWDVLRVNEISETANQIDDNNLEIVVRHGSTGSIIVDAVYIPMSRMVWKQP